MPNFHLHLHNAHTDASDEEGHELPNLEAACDKAMEGIRDFIGHEAINGKLDFRGQVDVADDSGAILKTIHFADAFKIIGL